MTIPHISQDLEALRAIDHTMHDLREDLNEIYSSINALREQREVTELRIARAVFELMRKDGNVAPLSTDFTIDTPSGLVHIYVTYNRNDDKGHVYETRLNRLQDLVEQAPKAES